MRLRRGEQPVVQSRYSIVIAAAKRARQIIAGSAPLVDAKSQKPLSIAVEELYKGKVKILGVDESDEDDEKIMEMSNEVFDVSLEDDEEDILMMRQKPTRMRKKPAKALILKKSDV